jgi:quercetin dioxygenase-like cupin family protein
MKSGLDGLRRVAIALVVGIVVGAVGMQALNAQAPTVKRLPLTKADLTGVEGKEVYVTLLEAQPGAEFAAHTHPGDEFLYVIEGSLDGFIEQTRNEVGAGQTFHVQREKVHGGKVIGSAPAKLLAVHIVDKGKPLMQSAKP